MVFKFLLDWEWIVLIVIGCRVLGIVRIVFCCLKVWGKVWEVLEVLECRVLGRVMFLRIVLEVFEVLVV